MPSGAGQDRRVYAGPASLRPIRTSPTHAMSAGKRGRAAYVARAVRTRSCAPLLATCASHNGTLTATTPRSAAAGLGRKPAADWTGMDHRLKDQLLGAWLGHAALLSLVDETSSLT